MVTLRCALRTVSLGPPHVARAESNRHAGAIMEANDIFTAFSSLAARTECPACGGPSMEFLLRCDLSYGGCLNTTHCTRCGMSFEIEVASEVAPDHSSRDGSNCLCHGSADCAPSLTCDLGTRVCTYVDHCSQCGSDAA